MNSMIISYDLLKPGHRYDALIEAIKSYGTWAHITESTWFIKTDQTCSQVRDTLSSAIDNNDLLFVAKLTGAAAWTKVLCSNDYLKNNL